MEKVRAKLEIYEEDPFGNTCCGPGPRVTSLAAVEKLRKMLQERSEIVKQLSEDYKDDLTIRRDTISRKRQDYPGYVMKLVLDSKPPPYIFIDGEPFIIGKFPPYEEFTKLLKAHLKNDPRKNPISKT